MNSYSNLELVCWYRQLAWSADCPNVLPLRFNHIAMNVSVGRSWSGELWFHAETCSLCLGVQRWDLGFDQNLTFTFHKLLQSANSLPVLFSFSDPDKHYLMYEHERVPIAVCEKEPSSIIAFALRYCCDSAVRLTCCTFADFLCKEYLNPNGREQAWQNFFTQLCWEFLPELKFSPFTTEIWKVQLATVLWAFLAEL